MMRLKVCLLFLIGLFTGITFAQEEVKLKVEVSKNTLGINERLRVKFSINRQGADNFKAPKFTNFKLVGGPNQSVSQSFVNGKQSFSSGLTYFLQPAKKGELIISPATIEYNGQILKSEIVKIIVTDKIDVPKDVNSPEYIAEQSVRVETEISKSKVYVGEEIYLEHRMYVGNKVNIQNYKVSHLPEYSGFWNQEINMPDHNKVYTKTINGEVFRYVILHKSLLIPTKSGKLFVDPMKMEMIVGVPSGRFDFFGNPFMKSIRKEFSSVKKTILVEDLPLEGKPASFNGAVGDFTFDVSLSKDALKANETSQIKVQVTGSGNLKLFELPSVETPKELEIYEPERKEQVKITASGIRGAISDLYTVVPQYKGKYKIPNVAFSYFNPKEKKYHTIQTEDLFVNVLQGKELVRNISQGVDKQNVVSRGDAFRYIQTKTVFQSNQKSDFFKSNLFYILLLLPLISIPIGVFIGRKGRERKKDIVGNKQKKAEKLAKKYLAEAQKQLGKKEAFYEALERALHNYLKAKLQIETADISKDKISEILVDRGVDLTTINQFIEVLKKSDFARYTPITNTQMKEEFERAKQVIIQLDKQF